jgi:hypothetical protein
MRHWPVATVLTSLLALILVVAALAQQNPLARGPVEAMERGGLGDETDRSAFKQRGITATAEGGSLGALKGTGANRALLRGSWEVCVVWVS